MKHRHRFNEWVDPPFFSNEYARRDCKLCGYAQHALGIKSKEGKRKALLASKKGDAR